MSKAAGNSRPHRSPKGPDVRISVSNFGPIERGSIDLRPMNIFVGPSNTGKTYLAVLIYAIHKILNGFFRFPPLERSLDPTNIEISRISSQETDHLVGKLKSNSKPLLFSDLPKAIQEVAQSSLGNRNVWGNDLKAELTDCFDVAQIDSLIRMPAKRNAASIALEIQDKQKKLWDFSAEISASNIKSHGRIEEMVLLSAGKSGSGISYKSHHDFLLRHMRRNLGESLHDSSKEAHVAMIYLMHCITESILSERSDAYYLPAARSGIMQSHRVIASSMMAHSTRAGLERFSEPLTFSSMVADFMRRLILHDDPVHHPIFRTRRRAAKTMKAIADALERQTLDGRIRTIESSPGGYPEFVYRPRTASQDIRLSRSSSMVSELAPVVLFIRSNLGKGDTLIIEEPEAHLHPAAQTEMATALARLVRAGVRVVMTTHSEWLLQEIGNLMREGELGEGDGDSPSLQPCDVGVWWFDKRKGSKGSIVQEISFDRIEGIGPPDYDEVAESLYNRSADLQNRLAETTDGSESEA